MSPRPEYLVRASSLALGSLLGIALVAGSADAQNVRVLRSGPDPRTDSIVNRIYAAKADEVHRMVAEWREREAQLLASMRALSPDGDVSARRRLDEEFMRSSREAFAMMSAIQSRCESEQGPQPEGYIGVSLDTRMEVVDGRPSPSGVVVGSVEPGGPAERGGIQRHDRLLAIGGRDARQRIPEINDLLVPGRTVVVRVERGGAPRDLIVSVEPRPKDFAASCGEFERVLLPLRAGAFTGVRRAGPDRTAMRVEVGPMFERRQAGSPEDIRLFVFNSGGPSEGYFAGAKFRSLDDDWRELLGAKQGVMVYDVAAGSLAARAGLKGGDVVTAVGDAPATDPMVFVQLLGVGERHEATLTVLRERKPRTVTLRWGPPQP